MTFSFFVAVVLSMVCGIVAQDPRELAVFNQESTEAGTTVTPGFATAATPLATTDATAIVKVLLLALTSQRVLHGAASLGLPAVLPRMDGSEQSKDLAKKQREIAGVVRTQASQGLGGFARRSGSKKSERKMPAKGKGFGKVDEGLKFDRRPKPAADCACGSGQSYGDCCSLQHNGMLAADPASLVRARYSAYAYRLPDFLMHTTDPSGPEWNTNTKAWKKFLLTCCDDVEFQGLESISKSELRGDSRATVNFRANICPKNTLNLQVLCEKSSFVRDASGKWLYHAGKVTYEAQGAEMTDEDRERLAKMKEAAEE